MNILEVEPPCCCFQLVIYLGQEKVKVYHVQFLSAQQFYKYRTTYIWVSFFHLGLYMLLGVIWIHSTLKWKEYSEFHLYYDIIYLGNKKIGLAYETAVKLNFFLEQCTVWGTGKLHNFFAPAPPGNVIFLFYFVSFLKDHDGTALAAGLRKTVLKNKMHHHNDFSFFPPLF